ncbi:HAMP domain-containing sensor histidine kinase [Microbacterium horticulturae]|uniref:histidine kinase n=1 Tax=Microbacterium horticulturae TaxID=3028316 RepID=A0ABY8C082_9MICO|nr:HAMP domain-containing sensor histidine kinase [Microbacterium sp. KACC 23027]WEG09864.1 HAMP domain-containing sensor histidine kinase [Microbacterium sp. KACC 23027]
MTVAVLAIGLFVAGLGTLVFLRNALDGNLDAQVQQLAGADLAKSVFDIAATDDGVTFTPNASAPVDYSGYFIAVYDADGKLVASAGPHVANTPVLPDELTLQQVSIRGLSPFTIDGTTGASFRAAAASFLIDTRPELFTQLVALPTSSVNRIIGTYVGIYSVFALITIIAGALVTRWLVTLAFRSLGQVEATAMSIAAGDFSQRMSNIEPENTEVGRLKRAINAMLGQLDAAMKRSDGAVRQMRRFIGDASHELRTPLVTVRGYAELYRMGAIRSDEDVTQAMERIEKEATRMGALVEDLLALTRLDERREEVPITPVDLRPIARDAALDLGATAPQRPVTVTDTTVAATAAASTSDDPAPEPPTTTARHRLRPTSALSLLRRRPRPTEPELDDDLPPTVPIRVTPEEPAAPAPVVPVVMGEENRIRQVVTNLLTNARRYTPDASPIDLIVGVDAAAGTGWIAVADHGDGIPPQIRDQIFQRFWRADTSRTRETGGSGLGLSIVASIVDALNGAVAVEETRGGGATFRVSFPLAVPVSD